MTRLRNAKGPAAAMGGGNGIPGAVVLEPPAATAGLASLEQRVEKCLALLPPCRRLTVLVNDPQRHTASRPVLQALTRHLPPERIRLLIATGSHRAGRTARRAFEKALCRDLPFAAVAWHDSHSDALVPIGARASWRGHPWLPESQAILAIGSVEPHYFAGYTGAHKTTTIGVAAYADIEANHAAALGDDCQLARLAGNPVAEGIFAMLADLLSLQPVAAINLVQAGPRILSATAGKPVASLHAAVKVAEEVFVHRMAEAADAVVAEVAGPLGATFYQADKGIKNTEAAVRDGGCLVLVARCGKGLGQDRFVRLLREARTHAEARDLVASRGYHLGDHKAVRLRRLTDPAVRGVRGFLVSDGISAEQAGILGLTKAANPMAALAAAGIDPRVDRVYHVRDAGNLALLLTP